MVNDPSFTAVFTADKREVAALAAGARLGLRHEVNRLVAYDPRWPLAFALEEQRLRTVLDGRIVAIEHHGSTAVPGLCAKPIIDILIGVEQQAGWLHCKAPLAALGYAYAEHAGVPEHFIFGRGRHAGERTHLVHVVEFDSPTWHASLTFRNALRADPALAAQYAAVKQRASHLAPTHRAHYTSLKAPFILATLAARMDRDAGEESERTNN